MKSENLRSKKGFKFYRRMLYASCVLGAFIFSTNETSAQCVTNTQCLVTPEGIINYVYTPIRVNAGNSTITADPTTGNGLIWSVVSTNVTCVTTGSSTVGVDMLLTISSDVAGGYTDETGTNLVFSANNRSLQFNGDYYKGYIVRAQFFETGTNNPVNVNLLQQITDMDGDGDWNNDGTIDDPRVNSPFASPVRDDYAWAAGFNSYHTGDVTLIYTRQSAGRTYFHSSGSDNNGGTTAITGIVPTAGNTQAFLLTWENKNEATFGYFAGQYGGFGIDISGEGISIATACEPVTISGTVFIDENENTIIDGAEASDPIPNNLYIYLIDALGIIKDSAHVRADGSYTLTAVKSTNYTLKSSTVQYAIGDDGSAINTLPPVGYSRTGENKGNTIAGNDGTPDGILLVSATTTNVSQYNFGLKESPTFPIRLTSFTTERKNATAYLQWITASEDNNKGFTIEHSVNGATWSEIGFIASKAKNGKSQSQLTYDFTHKLPVEGKNFYRLKQEDFDGRYEYSEVRTVEFSNLSVVLNVFPNPVKDVLIVSGLIGGEKVSVINTIGQQVYNTVVLQEATTLNIDMRSLPEGVYFIRVETTEERHQFRVINTNLQ